MDINPYSNEARNTFGLMAHQLVASRPRRVRIASTSPTMATALARYLPDQHFALLVENSAVEAALAETLGISTEVIDQRKPVADAAVFPFSLEAGIRPTGERTVVAACYNAISYKSLLYPKSARGTAQAKMAAIGPRYRVRPVAGLFSPRFVLHFAFAKLFERYDSARYYQIADRAMRRLIDTGPLWRFSYIVVFTGTTTA